MLPSVAFAFAMLSSERVSKMERTAGTGRRAGVVGRSTMMVELLSIVGCSPHIQNARKIQLARQISRFPVRRYHRTHLYQE
jgi:hypothetical protein